MAALVDVDLPRYLNADVVVSAPDAGPGNWAGGASCVLVNGVFWLGTGYGDPSIRAAELVLSSQNRWMGSTSSRYAR